MPNLISIEEFIDRAMDVPFLEHGRDYNGWDCWGLVVCGQRDVYGVKLPDLSNQYSSTRRLQELSILIDKNKPGQWAKMLLFFVSRSIHVMLV